jgi:hypothetical protein
VLTSDHRLRGVEVGSDELTAGSGEGGRVTEARREGWVVEDVTCRRSTSSRVF